MINKEKGNIAIITALAISVLFGFCALAADLALVYAEKTDLQNAVDAAALAGAQELPSNPESAYQIALEYASQNGINASVNFDTNYTEIIVTSSKNVPTFFARILGINSETVTAKAKAMVVPVQTLIGAVPLCVLSQDFVYGQQYQLKNAPPDGQSGWYGALRLDGKGASNYEHDLAYGSSQELSVGQIVEVEHGNMSGPTKRGLEKRLSLDTRIPRNTFENHDRDAPQIIYLPVVEVLSEKNNSIHEVKILGFAAFFVESVSGNGNDSVVTGRFLRTIVFGGKEKSSMFDSNRIKENVLAGNFNDYGLLTIKLVMN